MATTATQDAWVGRVLGVEVARAATTQTPTRAIDVQAIDVQAVWRTAKERVDASLNTLSDKLRGTGNPDMERIGAYGLFGLGRRETVSLKGALYTFAATQPAQRKAAGAALRQATAAYRTLLLQHPAVTLIDRNPLGVSVGVQATLVAALDEIDRAAA